MIETILAPTRTECEICHARHGKAEIRDHNGLPTGNSYCFACGSFIKGPQIDYKPRSQKRQTTTPQSARKPDHELLNKVYCETVKEASQSILFRYLESYFELDKLRSHFENMNVGTDLYGATVYWILDSDGRPIKPNVIKYSYDGHRDKEIEPAASPIVNYSGGKAYFTNKGGYITKRLFNQIELSYHSKINPLDGTERVLTAAPVIIVESEKTAVIGSLLLPDYIFIASGGASKLNDSKIAQLLPEIGIRSIFLLFDNDSTGTKQAEIARGRFKRQGKAAQIVNTADLLPGATDGADLADCVLSDMIEGLAIRNESLSGCDCGSKCRGNCRGCGNE